MTWMTWIVSIWPGWPGKLFSIYSHRENRVCEWEASQIGWHVSSENDIDLLYPLHSVQRVWWTRILFISSSCWTSINCFTVQCFKFLYSQCTRVHIVDMHFKYAGIIRTTSSRSYKRGITAHSRKSTACRPPWNVNFNRFECFPREIARKRLVSQGSSPRLLLRLFRRQWILWLLE